MVNIILGQRRRSDTPRPSNGLLRPFTSTLKPAQPFKSFREPSGINKDKTFMPSHGGKQHLPPTSYDRRRTRSHVEKLNTMKPDGNWINEDGLEFAPKKRKVVKLYSPCWSLDYLGNNHAVFRPDNDMRLPFASISIKERLVTSHLERNFNGEKMLWAREDWEANSEQVFVEEERIREKRRRGRKGRERKGAKSSIQRRRKLKESKRAALIKIEESEAKVEGIGVEMGGDFLFGPSAADDVFLLGSSATNDKETQTPIDELRKLAAEPTGIDINSAPALTPLMLLKMKKKNQIRADILAGSNQSGMRP